MIAKISFGITLAILLYLGMERAYRMDKMAAQECLERQTIAHGHAVEVIP